MLTEDIKTADFQMFMITVKKAVILVKIMSNAMKMMTKMM